MALLTRRSITSALVLSMALTGCARTAPSEVGAAGSPTGATTTGGSTASASSSPSTDPTGSTTPTETRSGAPSGQPTPGQGTDDPSGWPLTSGSTRVVPTRDPDGMTTPPCPRPPTPLSTVTVGPDVPMPSPDPQRALAKGTNHSVAATAWAYPASQVQGWLRGTIPMPKQKIAFLTFDDGPNGVRTPEVLKILAEKKVPATFFVLGREVGPATSSVLHQQIAQGHAVALHGYGHNYGYLYPHRVANAANVSCDMQWGKASLEAVLGKDFRTTAMRYPGGHLSWKQMAPADAALEKLGMSWVDWNAMTGDADSTVPHDNPDDLVANVERTFRMTTPASRQNVMVLLQHDSVPNKHIVAALPRIIDQLRAKGYSFGIIS